MSLLSPGSQAPFFVLLDQYNESHSLTDYRGKWVLIYFYPKDATNGCIAEACNLRDYFGDFDEHDVVVLGMSSDTIESHAAFAEEYLLPFTLLSDPLRTTISEYGVADDNEPYGTRRVSFLVNPDGVIVKVYLVHNPESHAQEVLQDIRMLVSPKGM